MSAQRAPAPRGRPGRPPKRAEAALGHTAQPGRSTIAASAQEPPEHLKSSLKESQSLAQSGPGEGGERTISFANLQEIYLPAGFSQFRLRNPELTNNTARRVFKVLEISLDNESFRELEGRHQPSPASPRLETSDKERIV